MTDLKIHYTCRSFVKYFFGKNERLYLESDILRVTCNLLTLQLRDVALRRLQVERLDSLPGLVFISAFLATAGKDITKLTLHSEVMSY